ncbi:hypothetical protein ACF0H5_020936 [Mactra antiquata]
MDTSLRKSMLAVMTVVVMVYGTHAGCVDELKPKLKPCFDQLKNSMKTEAPSDVDSFFCSESQTDRLDCVIKNFNECPEFAKETFIEELKHSTSDFRVYDLFHVKSAKEFCKCAPSSPCLEKVDVRRLSLPLSEGPWDKIANQEYICGVGFKHIDCVAKTLPACEEYFQYKHNESLKSNNSPPETHMIDIGNFVYASDYADRHCKKWPSDDISHECTVKRAGWHSVIACNKMVKLMEYENDRTCGMRRCIEIDMATCPNNDMAYFIDAVNIFSDVKIDTTTCISSANVVAVVCNSLIMLSLLFLFL